MRYIAFISLILILHSAGYTQSNTNSMGEPNKTDKKDWLLDASSEGDDLLKLIGKYIETYYGVSPNYTFSEEDEMLLIYDQKIGDSPEIRIYVEALPTLFDKEIVVAQRIRLSIFVNVTEFIKNENGRNEILELNNKWQKSTWVPHRFFITSDDFIAIQSSINIPGKDYPIPIEMVKDLISSTLTEWEFYSEELKKTMK